MSTKFGNETAEEKCERKCEEAEARQEARATLSKAQQLAKLNKKGLRAEKERARLNRED